MKKTKMIQALAVMAGLLVPGIVSAAAPADAPADVTLVRDGKPVSVIVLEAKPTRSAQMGALELQHHVKLITGATLPILKKKPAEKVETVIYIGGRNKDLKEETSIIQFKPGEILLTGGDTLD